MDNSLVSWRRFKNSFIYAWNGIWQLLKKEQNLWIIAILGAMVLFMAWWYRLAQIEWTILILAVAAVVGAEILNTAVELISDKFQLDKLEKSLDIKIIKDVMAGFVLIWSLAAAVVVLLIFWPYIIG